VRQARRTMAIREENRLLGDQRRSILCDVAVDLERTTVNIIITIAVVNLTIGGAQWRILTGMDGHIRFFLVDINSYRRLDGGRVGGGGQARDGQQDDNGWFQQDHFVECTMVTMTNVGVWYRVRTDKEDVDNQKNRRESVDANTRLETTRQQHTKR